MKGFDDIVLTWQGEEFRVPATRQMELILRVEEGLLRRGAAQAFHVLTHPEGPPMALAAQVYAEALAYAGATVSAREIFAVLIEATRNQDAEPMTSVQMQLLKVLGVIAGDDAKAIVDEPGNEKKTKSPAG